MQKKKGNIKHPQNLQGRLEPAFCLTTVQCDSSRSCIIQVSWKSFLSSLYINVKGKCWDTSDQIQQAVLVGVLTLTFLWCSAPTRLYCFLLEKAQFGWLKPVLTQDYQVFLSYYGICIFTAHLSKTLRSAVTIEKSGIVGFWGSPVHHLPLCSHSVYQEAVGIQAKMQRTALESLFV